MIVNCDFYMLNIIFHITRDFFHTNHFYTWYLHMICLFPICSIIFHMISARFIMYDWFYPFYALCVFMLDSSIFNTQLIGFTRCFICFKYDVYDDIYFIHESLISYVIHLFLLHMIHLSFLQMINLLYTSNITLSRTSNTSHIKRHKHSSICFKHDSFASY